MIHVVDLFKPAAIDFDSLKDYQRTEFCLLAREAGYGDRHLAGMIGKPAHIIRHIASQKHDHGFGHGEGGEDRS